MHRLFWLMAGMVLGALAYRYLEEQSATTPELESLSEQAQRLTDRGRDFADSSRRLAETGRQLAEEGRTFAQAAAVMAQSRGREMFDQVKSQADRFRGDPGEAVDTLREDVREDTQTS